MVDIMSIIVIIHDFESCEILDVSWSSPKCAHASNSGRFIPFLVNGIKS